MADSAVSVRRSHARHDRFAIAEALSGGSVPITVGTCPACGVLHRDLLSIQTAIRHAWTPRRPRDLRLTTADVTRLRPILWRRLLAVVGSSRDAVTRPLAVGLTGLGLAGFVVANLSLGPIGASGSAAASLPPETAFSVEAPTGGSATDDLRAADDTRSDPLNVLSASSLAAGGGIFGLRRLAARARAMR